VSLVEQLEAEVLREASDAHRFALMLSEAHEAVSRVEVALANERARRSLLEESNRRLEVALAKVRLAIGERDFARIVSGP
jgi:hypothetical protein